MKFTSKAVFIAAIFLIGSAVYSQGKDTLYFCREYKNGIEIGLSNVFAIGPGGDSITVMVRTKGQIKEKHVSIVIERASPGEFERIGTHKFDVQPEWDYIFFAGINFWKEGYYAVRLLREDGSEIVSGYVTMILITDKIK